LSAGRASLEQLGKSLGVRVRRLHPVSAAGVDAASLLLPGYGILEDPVTGSGGSARALIQTVLPGALPRRLVFTQGDEMAARPGGSRGRPDPAGKVRGWIGGNAVTVLRGS